jgi:hypothetical protein
VTTEELLAQPATRELRQVLLDLSLISHVRGVSYDSSGGGGAKDESSGQLPPGGPDRKGDREDNFRQKTHFVFLRRYTSLANGLHKLSDARAESIRDEILTDARRALRDWRKTPTVPGRDPDHGSLQWKIRVANDDRSSRIVAGVNGISHVTVLRYREQYRGLTE